MVVESDIDQSDDYLAYAAGEFALPLLVFLDPFGGSNGVQTPGTVEVRMKGVFKTLNAAHP